MIERPSSTEADPHFFTYIDQVTGNVQPVLAEQLEALPAFFASIDSQKSLSKYSPDKWSIREVLSHITDTERVFSYRALWFARGFDSPLPSFDQEIGVAGAQADNVEWEEHIEEFRRVRLATIALFDHLPEGASIKTGIASNKQVSVRALAYMIAGHATHHVKILRERYL